MHFNERLFDATFYGDLVQCTAFRGNAWLERKSSELCLESQLSAAEFAQCRDCFNHNGDRTTGVGAAGRSP
ncbi:hypothetical protein PC118_g15785 [Phytophthora cactorum]|uniref:Uncharacterized protein n=1 Tax=Phytophthora cactorum TaxID=29920 RepID=A0A8T1FKJ4_9STRA|nr:hypothetical protein PC118_g15785 [Phytophthora cactorum]